MTVDSTSTAGAYGTASASTSAMTQLNADYTSFLKLLTAQVANQDPLEPMDSTTFVSQLAQLSQVGQSIVANSNLENISLQLSGMGAMADVQLIGHSVTLPSSKIELREGSGAFSYELAEEAESVKAVIRHEDGTVVRELRGLSGGVGSLHEIAWDGLDDQGLPVPDGVFGIEIEAKDAEDAQVSYSGYATTRVEELAFRNGYPVLVLGNGDEASSAQVLAVQ
ncbi:MAG: flagellar hook assembly protein FlgD [Paracoccaceae bacterium]